MSLTSLLLGSGAKAADADLDALFTRTKVEAPVPKALAVTAAKASTSKAKIAPPEEIIKQAKLAKAKAGSRSSVKSTSNDKDTKEASSSSKGGKKDKKRKDADAPAVVAAASSPKQKQIEGRPSTASASSKKRRRNSTTATDADLVHETLLTASVDGSDEEDEDEDEDSEDDGLPLVHESVLLAGKDGTRSTAGLQPRAKKQAKHLNESKSDRDARTTFIGNVPIACATNKSSKKALVRHLIATLPAEYQSITKLDSIRFRSLQLATPAFDADGRDNTTSSTSKSNKQGDGDVEDDGEEEEQVDRSNNHARKRARKWKTGEVDSQNGGKTPKFLTASQKKKIGFIKGQVHEKASSCIAYAVWDTIDSLPTPSSTASTSKGATSATPQEIASLIVKYGNNTVFEGFTLRVDHVKGSTSTLPEGQTGEVELSTQTKRELALEQKAKLEEEKRTLYIGSLDFEEKEQAIRELCEKLMTEERGEPTVDNDTGRSTSWVERVRLVRDAETGLGKGFAYVMFKDRECVDEMLALDSTRVKLSKRKLRLERCKTSSAKAAAAAKAAKEAAYVARKEKQTADRKTRSAQFDASKLPSVPSIPKAPRPDIGDQLKSLSKEERKALKSSDDDRLTRRLEKKQAKREAIKLEKQKEVLDRKVKSAGGSSYKARVDPAKEGMRKKRMRSDNAVFAKNRKKTI